MDRVGRLDQHRGWKEISIVLVDDTGIKLLNQKHLENPEVTDVISFRYDPMPGDGGLFSGEIIVNAQRAAEEGRGRVSLELALYIAHGCDHLAGETDRNRTECARMRRRELRWLKEAHELGLVDNLVTVHGSKFTVEEKSESE